MEIKTKRLMITPLSADEMKRIVAENNVLEARYEAYLAHTGKDQFWYACWGIFLKDGTQVGQISFGGMPDADKIVTVGWYFIDEPYHGNGYAAEAIERFAAFAFSKRANAVCAYPSADNIPGVKTLEHAGFAPFTDATGVLAYVLERPATTWTSIFMCFGMSLGMLLGRFLFTATTMGLCVGMCLGVAVGVSLDAADRKSRKRKFTYQTEQKNETDGKE